jgi:hypothetical protein
VVATPAHTADVTLCFLLGAPEPIMEITSFCGFFTATPVLTVIIIMLKIITSLEILKLFAETWCLVLKH